MIPHIFLLISWLPDIAQKCFCNPDGAMDPTFQMQYGPAFWHVYCRRNYRNAWCTGFFFKEKNLTISKELTLLRVYIHKQSSIRKMLWNYLQHGRGALQDNSVEYEQFGAVQVLVLSLCKLIPFIFVGTEWAFHSYRNGGLIPIAGNRITNIPFIWMTLCSLNTLAL